MSRKVLVIASLVIAFSLTVLLRDISRALFTARAGDATRGDVRSLPGETRSSKGLSGIGQEGKAIRSDLVSQERSQVQASEQERKPIYSLFAPPERDTPLQNVDMPNVAQTQQILLPYLGSLRLRAIQAGVPPHQVAQLSADVAAVAWTAQLAGSPPAQAVGAARFFGESALSSSRRELSFAEGIKAATLIRQQQQQAIQQR